MPTNGSTEARKLRSRLNHPIIDADGHWLEYGPVMREEFRRIGGDAAVEALAAATDRVPSSLRLSLPERRRRRVGMQLGFRRAVVYYPDCRSVRPWKIATPVLMLLAGEDDVAPGKPCETSAKKSASPEAVKIVWYPGAYHAFDVSELPPKTRGPAGTIGFHAQAAAAAWEEIQRFLTVSR